MKLTSSIGNLLHCVLFVVITLLLALPAYAKFTVPPLTGRVVDAGAVFTDKERERIENAILIFEKETGGQMVVTTLSSLDGESIENVGLRLGNEWGIGYKGKDNGAILIIVVPERQMRLEVGIGWEKTISKQRAEDVINGLVPFFRANKYADGSIWAVESVQQYVTGKDVAHSVNVPKIRNDNSQEKSEGSLLGKIISAIIMLFVLIFSLFTKNDPNNSRRSSSSGGGFSGGGGHFGGHGASGRW